LCPTSLDEAVAALAERPRTILAGGTDHFPARVAVNPDEDILDISFFAPRTISRAGDVWRIPCGATWSDVIEAALPAQFDCLRAAARAIGGIQIQNAGTVVGNVCNASPAADGIPCLLTLDASIELMSASGARSMPLTDFLLGPRRTARRQDELVSAVLVPALDGQVRSVFSKLGGRSYLVISIAMIAVLARFGRDGTFADIRISVGACSATARRLNALEGELRGHGPDPTRVRDHHLMDLAPIDDARGTASYRRAAALELIRRAIADLGSCAREESGSLAA
jgi:CO/xanthine dehydrogenase FAD-binding subunit